MTDAAPIVREPGRIAILVIGVGRSGTSALTRVLNLLGAALPAALLEAGLANARGHWEPARLVALDDEILRINDRHWWHTGPFPQAWFATDAAAAFAARAADLIAAEYGDAPLLVIKDPRLCRIAPVMLAALDRLGIGVRVVLPLRHPDEMVRSVAARDGTDARTNELIWIRNIVEAEAATRGRIRVWTSFSDLLADWRTTATRIADTLGLRWPVPPEALSDPHADLDPGLRHFAADVATGAGVVAGVGPLALKLWQAAQHGLHGDEAPLRAEFDNVRLVIDELDRLNEATVAVADGASALQAQNAQLAALLRVTETRAASAEAQLGRLQARCDAVPRPGA